MSKMQFTEKELGQRLLPDRAKSSTQTTNSNQCLSPKVETDEECLPLGGCNAFQALRSLTLAAVTQNLPVLQCGL